MGEGRFTAGKEKGQEKMKTASRVLLCGLMVVVFLGVNPVRGDGKAVSATVVELGVGSLDEGEVAALIYTREEEKLARDTYLTLYGVWGMPVFSNVAASEQSHMDAVLRMLEKYGLEDPAEGKGVGEFTESSGLQPIYDALVESGSASVIGALEAGVFIEETDITDLSEAVAATDNPDLQQVYGNLLEGSARHLVAFLAHLADLVVE